MEQNTSAHRLSGARVLIVFGLLVAVLAIVDILRVAFYTKPNILLIVVDDLGVNDLGFVDPAVSTPNIDALAAQGTYYTRHYTDATCTVTRVGILTGESPSVHGFRTNAGGISPEVQTLPDVLRGAGYRTHHVGKWHVGYASRLAWPTAQGFDGFFGFLDQHFLGVPPRDGEWMLKKPTYRNPWLMRDEQAPQQHRGHLTELLAAEAVAFVESQRDAQQPWFLNVWTYAPHEPIEPARRFASRHPDTPAGGYLAMVESADDTVGRILDALEATGQAEDTLVIVASDNGGTNKHRDSNYPLVGRKGSFAEGGVRAPLLVRWPGKVPAGRVVDEVVTYLDYLPTLATVARARIPEGLPGRNWLGETTLVPPLSRNLYWEVSSEFIHGWGALSKDKRWRLVNDPYSEPALFDLEADPAAGVNVIAGHPDVARELGDAYRAWRAGARRVPLDYRQTLSNGGGELTGLSLQRVPGFDNHTFGIAVEPEAAGDAVVEVIAYQADQWQLVRRGDKLLLGMNGVELEAPAPPPGACHTIIVGSLFHKAHISKGKDLTQVDLFIDGELVAHRREEAFISQPDAFLAPTYIGQDDAGNNPFRGRLGVPVVLNERLMADMFASDEIGNGVGSLHAQLCPLDN